MNGGHLVVSAIGRVAVRCGVGVAVGVAARGVAVGDADSGSTKVAVAVLNPGTVTACLIVAPAVPATTSLKVTSAPASQPPVLILTA
jgi:hypothetical protein